MSSHCWVWINFLFYLCCNVLQFFFSFIVCEMTYFRSRATSPCLHPTSLKGLKYIIKFVFMALWSLLYKLEEKLKNSYNLRTFLSHFFFQVYLEEVCFDFILFYPCLLRVHFQVLVQFNTTVMTHHQHMNSHQYWLNLLSNNIQSIVKTLYNYILHLYLINVFWEISSNNYAANYATCTLTMLSKSYQFN